MRRFHCAAIATAMAAIGLCEGVNAAHATDLTAAQVRELLDGNRIGWGTASRVYLPDGRYEGTIDGRTDNGSYRVEPDGRLCWRGGVEGCFRFFWRDGVLFARRDDSRSDAELGQVVVEGLQGQSAPAQSTGGQSGPQAAAQAPTAPADQGDGLRLNNFLDTSALTLSGAARVLPNGTLVLTPPADWTAGSVFSTRMISTRAFSTFFAFRIDEPGGGGADGIALVAQTVSASLGEVGGGMGYAGVENSLAIEFDTWHNGWDADDNHTGLLINGDIEHRDFPAVPLAQPLEDGGVWYAWVDYDGMTLSLRLSRDRRRPGAATFAHRIDIPALLRSDSAYVGFASATGAAHARHEILEWTYLERYAPEDISESQELAADLQERRSVELDIEFEFNSDRPTADGLQKIARFSEAVRQLFDEVPRLAILGHTDAVGSDAYNQALSDRRAAAVREELVRAHTFPADRLEARGMGESALKYPDDPEAAGNRRVEIRLVE